MNPQDRFLAKYTHIKLSVETIIAKNSSYGVKRIKAALELQYGISVGRDTLGKLLKLWHFDLKRKIKTHKPNMIKTILIALAERTNLLIRSSITTPLQALTSDISEFKFNNGKSKVFMCVHKDVLGQMIYGYAVGLSMPKELVIQSFKMAVGSIDRLCNKFNFVLNNKLLVHQDRGSQYTSHGYVDIVLKHDFRLSYSAPGTPTHNAGQESFFGRFKQEWADEIYELKTFAEVQAFIKDKVQYYSYERIHTRVGYKPPYVYTKKFLTDTS